MAEELSIPKTEPCKYNCYGCLFVKYVLLGEMFVTACSSRGDTSYSCTSLSVEHITPFETSPNIVLRVLTSTEINSVIDNTALIIKIPKNEKPVVHQSAIISFKNEMLFYKNQSHIFNKNYFPMIYEAKCMTTLKQPVIVLDDLIAKGYVQLTDKINKIDMKRCLKLLAWFHANTFKIQKENFELFKSISKTLQKNKTQEITRRMERISTFQNNLIMTSLHNILIEQIKWKLMKIASTWSMNRYTCTIIHGCFIRSNIFISYGKKYMIRLINFGAIQYDSPSIDFGRIFFTNLPSNATVHELYTFFCDMLQYYLLNVGEQYATTTKTWIWSDLKQEIIDNLLFSYINLTDKEREAINNPTSILHMLHIIGSLD